MTTTTLSSRPQRPIGGYVHGGVVVVLLLAVATLALVVTPPSPPGIAEFAPQATETIDEALREQASQFGTGEGGDCGAGQECAAGGGTGVATTTTTTLLAGDIPPKREIEQNKVKHCVGNPPRQTEDPQSPPCANYWEGDNGGATSRGVTAQEIRVAYPNTEPAAGLFQKLLPHFNRRYQFYGRIIRGVPISVPNNNRIAFAAAADEAGVFAALDYQQDITPNTSGEPTLEELVRRKIVTVAGMTRRFTDAEIVGMSPYYWQYEPSLDFLQRQAGALACRLQHRPAAHGSPEVRLKPRKFAVVYERFPDGRTMSLKPLQDALARCGEEATFYEVANTNLDAGVRRAQDMRSKDITTMITLLTPLNLTGEMNRYSQVNWEPEMLMSGFSVPQHEFQLQSFGDASRRSKMFGIGQFNKLNPQGDEPAFWAAREVNPEDQAIRTSAQGHAFYLWYQSLLLLSSGIQQAGPRLTPTTFAEGLEKTRFPNPGWGRAPYWQGHVGFGPTDHTMLNDVTAVWWNESAPSYRSPTHPRAGWCYIDRGARYNGPTFPADIDGRFFDLTTCR